MDGVVYEQEDITNVEQAQQKDQIGLDDDEDIRALSVEPEEGSNKETAASSGDYGQYHGQSGEHQYGYNSYQGGSQNPGTQQTATTDSSTQSGKVFIGGVSWETTEDGLRAHFGKYGTLTDAALMKDKYTGQPRGFGFVTFADASGNTVNT
jgi:RNA recognition motif-containing protein